MSVFHTIKSALGHRAYLISAAVTMGLTVLAFLQRFVSWIWQQVGGGAPLGQEAPMIFGAPFWAWGIILFLGLTVYWFLDYAHKQRLKNEPKIKLEYEEKSPFVITEPLNSTEPALKLIRFRVVNIGVMPIENCLVKLESLKDKDGNEGAFTPIGLITQHQYMQNRKGGIFNLRGEEKKYINAFGLNEAEANSEILIFYENVTSETKYPNKITREMSPYKVSIAAYGAGTPIRKQFVLDISNGSLRLRELKGENNGAR